MRPLGIPHTKLHTKFEVSSSSSFRDIPRYSQPLAVTWRRRLRSVRDDGIVTMVDYSKIVCALLNHMIKDNLGRPLEVISAILKLLIIKIYKYTTYFA